jgi:hypothetical protein
MTSRGDTDKSARPPPMARPRPERLKPGVVEPERPTPADPREGDDLQGIEIDHARERPGQGELP